MFSHSVDSMTPGVQDARIPSPSLSPGVCSNSGPFSQWCHLTISSFATPFSFCLQSFPASGSSLMSQLFMSGGQSTRVSTLAIVLPMNMQGWFPLGLTGNWVKSTCWYWNASRQETGTSPGIICWWKPLWETCYAMKRPMLASTILVSSHSSISVRGLPAC